MNDLVHRRQSRKIVAFKVWDVSINVLGPNIHGLCKFHGKTLVTFCFFLCNWSNHAFYLILQEFLYFVIF